MEPKAPERDRDRLGRVLGFVLGFAIAAGILVLVWGHELSKHL